MPLVSWRFGRSAESKQNATNANGDTTVDSRTGVFPESEEDAKSHIAEIQERLNKLKLNKDILDIDSLLMLVAESQYSNSSHVFFELLQNAEDNSYGDRTPEIKIQYENGYVLFESNEIGFSKANVDSICTACKSSKVQSAGKQEEAIGEKGIGFKSVFRIASTVWISSGHYSFRFDKHEILGRVYPVWDPFPSHIKKRKWYTAILMKVLDNINPIEIVDSLKAIDPTILLFLNKIKQLELSSSAMEASSGATWRSGLSTRGTRWRDMLIASTIPTDLEVFSNVLAKSESESTTYYSLRYPVHGLPDHDLRPKNTDITLLFPTSIALIRPVAAYSYLPIRDYGFKFTIQSNFILIANRKEIDDNEWNRSVVEKLPYALLSAVAQFAIGKWESDLDYGWPLLLPLGGLKGSIFESLAENVKRAFSYPTILQDTDGNLHRPADLTYIPQAYRDIDGNPLIPPTHSSKRSLSEKYPLKTIEALNILGVENLSDPEFLKDLAHFIKNSPSIFQEMPDAWHNQVCKVLLRLVEKFKKDIQLLTLVPLRDGSWISSERYNSKPFFQNSPQSVMFPKGVADLKEIHPDVTSTSERGKLFLALGADTPSSDQLAWKIIFEHRFSADDVRPTLLPPRNAVAHLDFLFHSGRTLTNDYIEALLCLTGTEEVFQLPEVYIDSDEPFSAFFLAEDLVSNTETSTDRLKFLHPEYLEVMGPDPAPQAYKWLQETLRVRTLLRVAKKILDGTYEPHQDLLLISSRKPMDLLSTLQYHWDFYAGWFLDPTERPFTRSIQDAPPTLDQGSRQKLVDAISNIEVTCHGGAKAKLKEVFLPLEHLIELSDLASFHPCGRQSNTCSICTTIMTVRVKEKLQASHGVIPLDRFLDVSDAKKQGWHFLQVFGVGVEPDLELFLSRLRQIQGENASHLHVSRIYGQLGRYILKEQQEAIKKFFDEGAFVYIPDEYGGTTGTWHNFSECVWHTATTLKHVPSLSNYYHAHFKLFCSVLKSREVDLKLLKIEAGRLNPRDGVKHVASILRAISLNMDHRRGDISTAADAFEECSMFPVSKDGSAHREYYNRYTLDFDDFSLRTGESKDEWFISDSFDLQAAFEGRVRLSSLPAIFFDLTASALKLIMGLESRLLSRAATQDPIHATCQEEEPSLTKALREKTFYISALLVPQDRVLGVRRLKRARVVQCKEIQVSWTLATAKRQVRSGVTNVKSVCAMESESVVIYYLPGEIDDNYMPVHLANQLARVCNLYRPEDEVLLYQILTQNDHRRLRENLRARLGDIIFREMEAEFARIELEIELLETSIQRRETLTVNKKSMNSNEERPSETQTSDVTGEPIEEKTSDDTVGSDTKEAKPASDSGYEENEDADDMSAPSAKRRRRKKSSSEDEWQSAEEYKDESESDESTSSKDGSADETDKPYSGRKVKSSSEPRIIPRKDRHEDIQRPKRESGRREFMNMNSGVIFKSEPPTFLGEDTQDTRYFGELQVSRFLEEFLPKGFYDPNEHWTSHMRSYHGHQRFSGDSWSSTFTIMETKGRLRELVITKGEIDDSMVNETCTFHVQVCPTNTGSSEPFTLSNSQFETARRLALDKNRVATEVYILARVGNVDGDPSIDLYLDPWRQYLDGSISMESQSNYRGGILEGTSPLISEESINRRLDPQMHEIYRNFPVELDEIRLLRLELDDGEADELRGKFVRVNINSGQPFIAISYCWGRRPDPTNCAYFSTKQGRIPIGDSLAACLRCLRERKVSTLIWADALCINQNDNVEKTRQVRRMGQLYSTADKVVVWIGNEKPEDKRALAILNRLQGQSLKGKVPSIYTDEITQLESFLTREWFTRMWVIQELVLSSEVVIWCGNLETTWDNFMQGIVECEKILSRHTKGADDNQVENAAFLKGSYRAHALHRTRNLYQKGELFNFLKLRKMFFHNRSSRPRDKLFSLLHLAYDIKGGDKPFHPDYDSPDDHVLSRFVKWLAKRTSIPHLLYWAGAAKSAGFCSWMPNLVTDKGPDNYTYPETISEWETTKSSFSAGTLLRVNERDVVANRDKISLKPMPTIKTTVVLFDVIQECSRLEIFPKFMYFHRVLECFRRYIEKLDSYPTGDDNWQEEVLVKTLIGDAPGPLKIASLPYFDQPKQQSEWPAGFEKEVLAIKPNQGAHVYSSLSPESQKLLTDFWATSATFLRKFPCPTACLTGKGFVGVVPEANVGDKIMIMRDAKVPFVVRKTGNADNSYTLIGEAYIHGLMYYKESASFIDGVDREEIHLV
ncbi:hypothetical protein Dda_4217 [Drechslerella dactyloides]|uniref:Heterokaryon incompatibility domain-containing protein n=1 Tax=Drechslerella dactyloides TaxID=74499 RepID=A0AAD6NKJ2_DREDA|nr:hypothetical protein Dda_4217 [Drechslerella dactyloides]